MTAAGYDAKNPLTEYPTDVWRDGLAITSRFLFPKLGRDEAWREIGRIFLAGYFETIIGRVLAAAFPYFSARTLMLRAPRLLRSGIKELETDVEWLGETKVKLTMHGPYDGAGFFSAGIVEECFKRLKTPVQVEARALGDDSVLIIDWS